MMKLPFIHFLFIHFFCYVYSGSITITPSLQLLLNDMKLYKLDSIGLAMNNKSLHANDIFSVLSNNPFSYDLDIKINRRNYCSSWYK